MAPQKTLERWFDRLRSLTWDRARAGTFSRFLWKRFLDDRLFQAAGALAFTTAFAIVPLSMVVFGVLSAFPVYEEWSAQLSAYIFSNFVPSSARAVETHLLEFSKNAGKLTAVGVIVLVVSLLITLTSIEATFNKIWRVPTSRPTFGRLMVYWTVMTFGALLAAASLAISARFFALAIFETQPGQWLEHWLLRFTPILIEYVSLVVIYRVVPHRTIQWRYAALGAFFAVIMIEIVKIAAGSYLGSFGTYEKIYGTLALIPIFLGWVYFSWVAVLLGASLASSLSAFRYQPASQRLPWGYEFYGLLRLLRRISQARQGSASRRHPSARTDAHRCGGAADAAAAQRDRFAQSRRVRRMAAGARSGRSEPRRTLRSLPAAHPHRRSLVARPRRRARQCRHRCA